jgi:hypothetical protein
MPYLFRSKIDTYTTNHAVTVSTLLVDFDHKTYLYSIRGYVEHPTA